MKEFSVELKLYKYSKYREIEVYNFFAKDRNDAKEKARMFTSSTEWAWDITPIPDLRTVKEIKPPKKKESKTSKYDSSSAIRIIVLKD